MNNFHKAESGAVIFHDYAGAHFSRCFDRVPYIIAALLVDLMHFASAQGIDIEGCIEIARQRYDEDTGFNRDGP